MEKKLMRHYNRCLMGELGVYGCAFGTLLYMCGSLVTGTFSVRVANYGCIAPGMVMSAITLYARLYHLNDLEKQVEEIYKPQIEKYKSYFNQDKGYDEYD